jgi:hypothetical protein
MSLYYINLFGYMMGNYFFSYFNLKDFFMNGQEGALKMEITLLIEQL